MLQSLTQPLPAARDEEERARNVTNRIIMLFIFCFLFFFSNLFYCKKFNIFFLYNILHRNLLTANYFSRLKTLLILRLKIGIALVSILICGSF